MSKIHPAPWHWEYHPDTNRPIALTSKAGDVMVATGDERWSWADVSEDHMRLLEAAPALLLACRKVHFFLDELADVIQAAGSLQTVHIFRKILGDAIAEATGERP